MAKYTMRYENLAKELIREILGFQEWEENFIASMNYVMSNLLYHHYLDVNSHHIQRSLQGISLKMTIHGHQRRAERLLSLTDKLISSPNLQNKGDFKWSILCLLIELGQHPARDGLTSSFIDDMAEDTETKIAETEVADWTRELMLKSFHLPDKEETLSEWSDDDEMKRSFSLGTESVNQHLMTQKSFSTLEFKSLKQTEKRERQNSLIREYHQAKSWLANVVQRPYWSSDTDKLVINATNEERSGILLTEYVVIRECIWLLLVPSSGYIFKQRQNKFVIQSVFTSSMSKESLQGVLQPITSAASKLLDLDIWLKKTSEFITKEESIHTGTLQAYSDGLSHWRNKFSSDVEELEKKIFCGDGCMTLLWLLNELEPILSSLSIIHNIHCKALDSPPDSHLAKAFKLLGFLVQEIESGISLEHKSTLLKLLNSALKNHLKKLHSILWDHGTQSGIFLEEFGIERSYSSCNSTIHFKQGCNSFLKIRGLNFLKALREPLMKISQLREIVKHLELDEEHEPETLCKLVEEQIRRVFFQKRTLVESLENDADNLKLTDDEEKDTKFKEIPSLCSSQSESNELIYSKKEVDHEYNVDLYKRGAIEIPNQTDMRKSHDPIEQLYTKDLFLIKAFEDCELEVETTSKKSCEDEESQFKGSFRLEQLLTEVLLPVVQNRYNQLGKVILKTLLDLHYLDQQLNVFRSIVLLESSVLMQEFCSSFFSKIDTQEVMNQTELTQSLHYSLEMTCPSKLASSFSISFNIKEGSFQDTTILLNSLSLDFEDLWPLRIVVSKPILAKYNQIFGFCLMLKKATFTLEKLHFKDIGSFDSCYSQNLSFSTLREEEKSFPISCDESSDPSGLPLPQRMHRLQLLRQWLLYLSRILHDHFSTEVFLPFSKELENSIHRNSHFDEFLKEHVKLLNRVCHQCLFGEGQSPIQNFLTKIFYMVKDLRNLWMGHPSKISEHELVSLEQRYCLCHRLIANFFSTLAKVRLCPLVEGLAECLNYSCPNEGK